MKVTGSYEFDASPAKVWEVLIDPQYLEKCIPGCQELRRQDDGEYIALVTASVGPIRGQYNAKIAMRDVTANHSYRLAVEGAGASGFVNGEALITLKEQDGRTVVEVDGDSQVGGIVARVGQRMMGSVAKMMMDRFFGCLQESVR